MNYGIIVNNASQTLSDVINPDPYIPQPSANFVLCRDSDNNPTAIYGNDIWDFNPYRLSARKINKIHFVLREVSSDPNLQGLLVNQIKSILYNLIYHTGSGRLGKTSSTVFVQYFRVLRKLSEFCISQTETSLANINLFDLLSNTTYLNAFLSRKDNTSNEHKSLSAIMGQLEQITVEKLGFESCLRKNLQIKRKNDEQHPVIPSRIYIELIKYIDNRINLICPHKENIRKLIEEMDDPYYGAALGTQSKKLGRKNISKGIEKYRPTMEDALKKYGLLGLYTIDNKIISRVGFVSWITQIQYISKLAIHLYTGVREQEASRMMYDCIEEYQVTDPVIDNDGQLIDKARMMPLISTTTKFTGYKRKDRWLCPSHISDTISLLQSIAKGLAYLHRIELKDTFLFIGTGVIRSTSISNALPKNHTNTGDRGVFEALAPPELNITQEDLDELRVTAPSQNFELVDKYSIGHLWPLTSHQFRRSLAFYALNSGFVSLDTVSTQFKHTSRMMTQYYGKGNEHLLPIFIKTERNSQCTHIAFDFKISSPIAVVEQLYRDVFDSGKSFFGSTGSRIEQLKVKIGDDELLISGSKKETQKLVEDGHLSWRETPIGGCTGTGVCQGYLMGELTECLTKGCTVIDPDKVEKQIDRLKGLLSRYEKNSHEYEMAEYDLIKLEQYKSNRIDRHLINEVDSD